MSFIYINLFFSIFVLCFFKGLELKTAKIFALRSSGMRLVIVSLLASKLPEQYSFQVDSLRLGLPSLHSNIFGFDGIYVLFTFLWIFLIFIWNDPAFKKHAINLFLIELFALIFFVAPEPWVFRLFFDTVLLFIFLIKNLYERSIELRMLWLLYYFLYLQILSLLLISFNP